MHQLRRSARALYEAVQRKHLEVAKVLLEGGMSAHTRDTLTHACLHTYTHAHTHAPSLSVYTHTSTHVTHTHTLPLQLRRSARALYEVVQRKYLEVAKVLLEGGMSANALDADSTSGDTLLHIAAKAGSLDIVKVD